MWGLSVGLYFGCQGQQVPEPIAWQPCDVISLARAKQAQQPVMIDFAAPWCASCLRLDKQVFASLGVQKALKRFMTIRCDMQETNAATQAMLQQFDVQTLPNIVWLGADGMEYKERRIVSWISAEKFIQVTQQMR